MRKWILCLLMLPIISWAAELNLREVRAMYYSAAQSKSDIEMLQNVLEACPHNQPVYDGYRGALNMLRAQYVYLPTSKLQYFNKGKSMIETAIQTTPSEVELLFLRFTVQTNCPSFLGYNTNIVSDKNKIIGAYKNISDLELKKVIQSFMLASTYCTIEEKKQFK